MAPFRARSILGPATLLFSGIVLIWGIWPSSHQAAHIAVTGPWRLILDAPAVVRAGDTGKIRLTLEEATGKDVQSGTGTSQESARRAVIVPVKKSASPHLLAEARLEMSGMAVAPSDEIRQPVQSNFPIEFFWRARAARAGDYSGTLWLYRQTVAEEGSQAEREPVLVRQVEIKSRALLGLTGFQARVLGSIGALAGLSLFLFQGISFKGTLIR